MDVERAREFLLGLPHVVETMQWGDNLVFWVGDKAVGGKMFCLVDLDARPHGAVSFSAGPERFAELVEVEGMVPAPYMARIHWVAAERWDVLRNAEWESELRAAHAITLAKLPKGVMAVLEMPERARAKVIAERRRSLAAKAAAAASAKAVASAKPGRGAKGAKTTASAKAPKANGKKLVAGQEKPVAQGKDLPSKRSGFQAKAATQKKLKGGAGTKSS